MSIPTKEERAEWRKLAAETMMISAVGEYTPEEFTTLLDAVDELERDRDEARRLAEMYRNLSCDTQCEAESKNPLPWDNSRDNCQRP